MMKIMESLMSFKKSTAKKKREKSELKKKKMIRKEKKTRTNNAREQEKHRIPGGVCDGSAHPVRGSERLQRSDNGEVDSSMRVYEGRRGVKNRGRGSEKKGGGGELGLICE